MKYDIPVYAIVEADSMVEAQLAAKKIGELLNEGIVKLTLRSKGVRVHGYRMGGIIKQV